MNYFYYNIHSSRAAGKISESVRLNGEVKSEKKKLSFLSQACHFFVKLT